VYGVYVKRRDLEKRLCDLGWNLARHGGRHDVWVRGDRELAVPRHVEINDYTARAILREASGGH
jgi:mRNA interferase HicA